MPVEYLALRVCDIRGAGRNRIYLLTRNRAMMTVLIVILILLLIGALPVYPYSAGWGPYPSGILGTVLIIVLVLVLIGRV
jgi:uncharacterized integral membrane protein